MFMDEDRGLPDEIWIQVLADLSVRDIGATWRSCRLLHSLLSVHQQEIVRRADPWADPRRSQVEHLYPIDLTFASWAKSQRQLGFGSLVTSVVMGDHVEVSRFRIFHLLLHTIETSRRLAITQRFELERRFLMSFERAGQATVIAMCYDYELCIGAIFLTLPESRVFGAVEMQRASNFFMLQGLQAVSQLFYAQSDPDKIRAVFTGIVKESSRHVLFLTESNYIYNEIED